MAVFKIFPEKDTTIYSDYPTMNTGIDEILDLSKAQSILNASESYANRILIKFPDADINKLFSQYVLTASFTSSLKLYAAAISSLPTTYSIEIHPISESWDMGTGRFDNISKSISGASWKYRAVNNTFPWITSSYSNGVTGSFTNTSPGGGSWYTASAASQSFLPYSTKDVNIDVTNIILNYLSGSYVNNGFILKNTSDVEFNRNYAYKLTYFSRDTHTIYPPVLEIKWNDYMFATGSSSASIVSNDQFNISVNNNSDYYIDSTIKRFRINVRDKFPTRTFTTSSLYTTDKYLPTASYYSVIDAKTLDIVVDFDTIYTQISADSQGNYFDIYMAGLQANRYYKILIKSIITGNTLILDNNIIFRIK